MNNAQQTTATHLEANYGPIATVEPTEARFDQSRIIVQFVKGASVIINSNGTYIG